MKVFAFRNEKRVEEKSSSGGAFMAVIDAAFKLCKKEKLWVEWNYIRISQIAVDVKPV